MSKFFCHFSGIFAVTAALLSVNPAQAVEPAVANAAPSLDSFVAPVAPAPALEPQAAVNPPAQVAVNASAAPNPRLESLQNLNSRHNCSKTKVDSTASAEQINLAVTECLEAMEVKIAADPASVTSEDLNQLKALAQSFRSEAGALSDRLTKVEERIAQQPTDNFSTTTKLVGEVIVAASDVFGGSTATGNNTNTIISNRVRLNFRTSFTGKDLLITRLQARNGSTFSGPTAANTNMVRLGFEGNEENAEYLHLLQYQLPVGTSTKISGTTVGNELDNYLGKNFNPVLAPAGTGSISRFGRFNPVYRLSGEGAGLTIDHKFSKQFGVAVAYGVPRATVAGLPKDVANDPSNPNAGNSFASGGLFNGSNLLFSQLSYSPNDNLDLGFIYARSYHSAGAGVSGNNGTNFANNPFAGAPTSANHFSVLASTKLSPTVVLSGWAGITNANRETAAGSADSWNAAATLAFNDVGGKGSTLGFVLGVPPNVTGNSAIATRKNRDTPFHIESFYKYKVSDNLSITPGLVMILNPDNGAATGPALFLGTVRTTFSF
jgi:Carbohydrate-selective porin, OprB family